MQLYKYQFPTIGWIPKEDRSELTQRLESRLNNGPDCLMAYCMFPTDSDILDHVKLEMDEEGNTTSINLFTYTEMWDGNEEDFKDCVEVNLHDALEDYYGENVVDISVGDVKALGREGDIPKTLYHIAEKSDLEDIMKRGLIPGQGSNNYKNTEDKVFLTWEPDIAPWLAILKHKDDPVILEVKTEGLNIETGRVFKDREFVEGGKYGEYFSTEPIPASAIQEVDLGKGSNEFDIRLRGTMLEQLEFATARDEINEVKTGLERLASMGLLKEEQVDALVETRVNLLLQEGKLKDDSREVKSSNAEYADVEEGLPWDENDAGRGLTQALNQMSLADIGIKI